MTSTPTAIDFPDPTDPGFDETVPFEAPNGQSYLWNGYGWELVCEGADGGFLKRYGDTVDDATDTATYNWNKRVEFESEEKVYIYGKREILLHDENTNNIYLDDRSVGCSYERRVFQLDLTACRIDGKTTPVKLISEANVELGAKGFSDDPVVTVNGTDNKGYYTGLIEDDTSLVNKNYVDTLVTTVQEEIEAIAPTVQTGIWQDGNSPTPGTGHFAMRLGGGAITQDYEDTNIQTLIISTTDKGGTVHTFEKEEVGDEIQLFDVEDQNFGLFKIDAIDDTVTGYVSFTVTHLRGLGSTHVDDDVLIRTFKPVTTGDGSAYLLKNGETVNAPGPVNYQWDQNVDVKSTKILDIKGTLGCYLGSNGTVDVTAPDLNVYANTAVWMESKEYRFTNYSNSNIKWLHLKNGVIETDTTVSDTSSDKSLTTKKYVDDLFDFSQYDPLP